MRTENRLVVCEKLKKYNQHLTRALKTLEYINIMEFNSDLERTSLQSKELNDLKVNIQRQVLLISKQIKEYSRSKAA